MKEIDRLSLFMFVIAIFATIFFITWYDLTSTSLFMILVTAFASSFFLVAVLLSAIKRKISNLPRAETVTNIIVVAVSSSPLVAIILLNQMGGISYVVALVGTLTGTVAGVWLALLVRGVYHRLGI